VIGDINLTGGSAGGGLLQVTLDGGYVPSANQLFDILDWTGNLSGAFTSLQLPTLSAPLRWNTSQLYAIGVLSVMSRLAGDYNADGVVNAADYILWRNMQGRTGTGLVADGSGNGIVDQDDYAIWKGNFGATLTVGVGSASGGSIGGGAVPEPATLLLISIAGTILLIVGTSRCLRTA
jgi:hypothetical protein